MALKARSRIFEINAVANQEPVEPLKSGGNVIRLHGGPGDDTSGGILD